MQTVYLLLANAVLILHGLIVAFNIGALPVIWAGYRWHWPLVRNAWFRVSHLVLLGSVCIETSLGLTCPLTNLENALRMRANTPQVYSGGFVSHWLHWFVFWDVSPATMTALYWAFFGIVALTFFLILPGQRAPVPALHADRRHSL